MINRYLRSDRNEVDFSFALSVEGYVAEINRKIKKDYCKVDQIYDKYIVDVAADDLGCDTAEISGDDQQKEGKACSLGSSCLISFHHVDRPGKAEAYQH